MSNIETEFHNAMVNLYRKAKEECNYDGRYFIQMVAEIGGVSTARKLLATSTPSEGFIKLWKCGRLNLTSEALMLEPRFRSLFTEDERKQAIDRLRKYGYAI
jgi:hypothetical protein